MREFLNKIKTFFMTQKEKDAAAVVTTSTITSDNSPRKDPDQTQLAAQTLQGLGTGVVTTPPTPPVVDVVEQPVTQPNEAAWPFPTTRPGETTTKKPRKPRAKKTTPHANV